MSVTVRFLLYAGVGAFCTLLNLVVLWLLTSVAGIHYLISTMICFVTLTPVGFWLNKVVTFRTRRELTRIEWPRYFAIMGTSFAANVGLMYVLVSLLGVWYVAASFFVTVLLLVSNFIGNDRWSFSTRS